jgi:hypothetical protein
MSTKSKSQKPNPRTKNQKTALPRKAWERLTADERQEVRRFLQFLDSRHTEQDPQVYVNPVSLVLMAASQAEAMRHETYTIDLLHKLTEHNRTKLVPALCQLMQWAIDLQREVNQIDAKMILALKTRKRKAGSHAKRPA